MSAAEDVLRQSSDNPESRQWLRDRVHSMIRKARPQQPQGHEEEIAEEIKIALQDSDYRLLPVLVGCIVPVSILINVPSISSSWAALQTYNTTTHVYEDPTVEVPLPHYINALVIIALVNAVICNVFIFIRFLEHQVYLSTVIGLITATIQDILSLAAVIPFCRDFRLSEGYVYEEGFWSMVASMVFSFAATILMSIDLHMTPNFRAKGSGVTHKQRILIIEAMGFCFYLALGALCIYFIEPDWTFLESLFFAMVTITTIGFGDRVITSTGGRFFVIAYASGGIVLFAVCINGIRYVIMEDLHQRFALRAKMRKAKREADKHKRIRLQRRQRRLERLRLAEQQGSGQAAQETNVEHTTTLYQYLTRWVTRRVPHHHHPRPSPTRSHTSPLKSVGPAPLSVAETSGNRPTWRHPTSSPALDLHRVHTVDGTEVGPPAWISVFQEPAGDLPAEPVEILTPSSSDVDSNCSIDGSIVMSSGVVTDDALSHGGDALEGQDDDSHDLDRDSEVDSDECGGSEHVKSPGFLSRLTRFRRRLSCSSHRTKDRSGTKSPLDQEREQAYHESISEYRRRVQLWVVIFLFFWVLGATVFTFLENWDYATSIYFVFVAFSTIGYGDVVPQTIAGRSFFLGYCLVGVVTVTSLASVVSELLSKKMRRHVVDAQLKKHRKLVGSHGQVGGGNHLTSQGDTDTTRQDLERGPEQMPEGEAFPSAENMVDTFHPDDEHSHRANLKRMVKVSEDFRVLLHNVLVSSNKEHPGIPSTTDSPVYPNSNSEGSQRLHPPTQHLSRSTSPLDESTSVALSWQETNSETKRSVYEYLSEPEDNPSISRDLDVAREEVSSLRVWHPHRERRGSRSRTQGLASVIPAVNGSTSHSETSATSEPIKTMEWPATPPTPCSVSSSQTVPSYHPPHNTRNSRPNNFSANSPTHHRVDQILRTSRGHQHGRKRPCLEKWQSEPLTDSGSGDPYVSATMATFAPSQCPDQVQSLPSPPEHHFLKIDSRVFSQLCAYADDCQRMMRDYEATLDRLAAWEKREQKLHRKRQKICEKQEALLCEREKRLMRGQRGDIGDEIEDEQELVDLTRQAMKLLSEKPVGSILSSSRRQSSSGAGPGASRRTSAVEPSATAKLQRE
ncbi:hypothetical protein BGZ73_000041 [Actinomortierella ambigua]|nr:hypothetical protein BGZ73_000041 [Actinomortierella ambigua]